jgi:hypothetical protein
MDFPDKKRGGKMARRHEDGRWNSMVPGETCGGEST